MRWRSWIFLLTLALLAGLVRERTRAEGGHGVVLPRPEGTPRIYAPSGRLEHPSLQECSGIVASRRHAGVFWVHNDSGNAPELFAVDAAGKHRGGPVTVEGARNHDWEDIALDASGRLIVADVGNNLSARRDLLLYVLPEPDLDASSVKVEAVYPFTFADQSHFPSLEREFDCESVCVRGQEAYLFTKSLVDGGTRLYRLELGQPGISKALPVLAEADVHGRATAADLSPDGKSLALLALHELWVFDLPETPGALFHGRVRQLSLRMGQAEAVAFDGNDALLIVNEGRNIYRVPLVDLKEVRPDAAAPLAR